MKFNEIEFYLSFKRTLLFLGALFVFHNSMQSQSAQQQSGRVASNPSWIIKPFERKAFIENKGQFNKELSANQQSFDYCIDKGTQVFFYKNQLCYRLTKFGRQKGTILNIFESEEKREERQRIVINQVQVVNVKWLNANPNATIVVEGEQSTAYSYTIKEENQQLSTLFCKGYSKLIYKNLYPGVDVEYKFHPENGIKYNLILQPGADISEIKMEYTGAQSLKNIGGDLHISTIIGEIIDHAPVSFYTVSNQKLTSSFTIDKNIVSFNVENVQSNLPITIDPWTVVPGFTPSKAYDNGTDNAGNVYVYGGSMGSYTVEKYPSTGGSAIWSLNNMGVDRSYYGDMLVDGAGNFYLSEGFVANGAHTFKYSPTSSLVWQSTFDASYREHWRLALNCVTNKVIVAGGGTTSPTLNIAEIDVTTGSLVNAKSVYNGSQSDVAGLCVDELGQAYLKHSNPNIITFTDNTNTFVANVNDGYNLSEIGIGGTPTYYSNFEANGYNFMALGDTNFLFTSDGATIKKYDRNTHVVVNTATIPGGQQNLGSGILADNCNNLFVGASNGVYRYDFNLVQKEFKSTTAAVFDIAYSSTADIIASGDGFITPLPFGRESCGSNDTIIFTSDPCNPEINTVTVLHPHDNPPYNIVWDDGNTDSVRTNLTFGNHIVTIKSGLCNPAIFVDTVKITTASKALSVVFSNPLCHLSTDGDITVELLKGQQITSVTWTPSLTHAEPNDSTTKATGLVAGTYSCHVSSSFGCSFDTTVTLVAPPQLTDSLVHRHATCPTSTDGVIAAFAHGGVSPYTYSWDTNPAQTTSTISNLPVGTYHLMISDSNNCKIIDSVIIDSNPAPTADYTVSNPCYGDSTTFTNQSNISSGAITSVWHFGNNNDSLIASNAMYLYPQCNTNYSTSLTVISDSGCVASISKPATVNCMPDASFTANDTIGCEPVCVTFQNNPLVPNGVMVQWAWQLGDGGLSSSQTFDHCYNNDSIFAPNYYSVSLIVTTNNGCADTVTKTNYITVYPNPVAAFTADPSSAYITSPEISFINQSVGATLVEWRFGDTSAVSTLYAPSTHTYADTGSYTIQLVTNTQYGCTDTTYRIITIEPDFSFYIPNAFSPNKDGVNDTFNGTGVFIKDYEMRIFDRWGNMIYMTNSLEKPWDGTANGGSIAAQQDVYIYVVQLLDIKSKKHNYRGTVTLIR